MVEFHSSPPFLVNGIKMDLPTVLLLGCKCVILKFYLKEDTVQWLRLLGKLYYIFI